MCYMLITFYNRKLLSKLQNYMLFIVILKIYPNLCICGIIRHYRINCIFVKHRFLSPNYIRTHLPKFKLAIKTIHPYF